MPRQQQEEESGVLCPRQQVLLPVPSQGETTHYDAVSSSVPDKACRLFGFAEIEEKVLK